jgi:hypothetical protein
MAFRFLVIYRYAPFIPKSGNEIEKIIGFFLLMSDLPSNYFPDKIRFKLGKKKG